MIICALNKVGKMYGAHWVYEDISLEIHEGERIGVVGTNGSGKTTLIKLIAGVESIDKGELHIRKGSRIGYLEQIPHVSDGYTVRQVLELPFAELRAIEIRMKELEQEMGLLGDHDADQLSRTLNEYSRLQNEFENRGGYEIDARINEICQGLQIHNEMQQMSFADLSGGEKTKVKLATILMLERDVLLLDEPTNHLDLLAIEWLEEYLRSYKGTVVIVSHDRYFLDRVVNKIIDIDLGECHTYYGNYSQYVMEKEERLLAEFQDYQEQQKKIKKMEETIKRLREWANRANPPNAGLHRRANSMQKALDRINRLKRPVLERKKIGLSFDMEERSGKDVVQLVQVNKSFGDRTLFQKLDFLLRYRDRVAIVGGNGMGKSTLIKMIMEQVDPDRGIVKIGSNVKIGYLSQTGIDAHGDLTVIEVFRDLVSVTEGEARHLLARFLFYGAAVYRKIKDLSGGERMRLRLAQLMNQEMNLLLLDEPTNHLDIDSREVLEEALADFDGTILAVSHDRYFLNKLFPITYWLESGTLTRYEGSFQYTSELRKNGIQSPKEVKPATKHTPPRNKRIVTTEKQTIDLKLKEEEIEDAILRIEEKLYEMEQQIDKLSNQQAAYLEIEALIIAKKKLEDEREFYYNCLL